MRCAFSIFLSLAVLTGFAEAPFLHTHEHDATQHHPGPFFHFHIKAAHATSRTREFRGLDPNDDVQYQTWFRATPTGSGSVHIAIPNGPFVLPPLERGGRAADTPSPVGHDPPLVGPKNLRAPPA